MINQIKFNGSEKPTLGVELELFTANSENYSLTNGAPKILKHFEDNFFFKEELLQCIVEITTDVCDNISDIINNFRFILYLAGGHTWYTEHTNVRRALKARPPFLFFSRVHPSVVPK